MSHAASAGTNRRPRSGNPGRRYVLAGGITLIAILVWAFLPDGTRAQPGFYQTAAQIIPVLILALAVEGLWGGWTTRFRGIVLAPMVLGEIAALTAAAVATQVEGGDNDGEYLVRCSAKVVRLSSSSSEWCAQKVTDMLAGLTAFGLLVGLVAVLLTTLAAESREVRPGPSG